MYKKYNYILNLLIPLFVQLFSFFVHLVFCVIRFRQQTDTLKKKSKNFKQVDEVGSDLSCDTRNYEQSTNSEGKFDGVL